MSQPSSIFNMTPVQAYEKYMVPALFIPAAQSMVQFAGLVPGQRVLDVACGTGVVARHAAPLVGTSGKVTGLDINPAMLAMARSIAQPPGAAIEWQEGSVLALPFENQAFDAVLCQQGLQFFPDRAVALREMHRVLVADGRCVVSVQQSLDANPIYDEFNQTLVKQLGIPALVQPFNMGDADALTALLTEAGFRNVETLKVEQTVHFPSPEIFVQATLLGSAAVLTALNGLDANQRRDLEHNIHQDMRVTLEQHTRGGAFVFELASLMSSGRA